MTVLSLKNILCTSLQCSIASIPIMYSLKSDRKESQRTNQTIRRGRCTKGTDSHQNCSNVGRHPSSKDLREGRHHL